MKTNQRLLLLLLIVLPFTNTYSQIPQAIPFQGVARDNGGNLIVNQNVSLRFSVHNSTTSGTIIYSETQSTTTNSLGLFTVNIGQGAVIIGPFSSINWGTASKFLQVEMDASGGSSYVNMGTQQMLSVPYAFYSASSGTSQWTTSGSNIYNSNSGNIGIGNINPSQKLEVSGTTKTTNFQMPTGASQGFILRSDANGNGNWTDPAMPTPQVPFLGSNINSASIPDQSCTGLTSSITLSGLPTSVLSNTIAVTLNISMNNLYDIDAFLISPNNDVIILFPHAYLQANLVNTVFSDASSNSTIFFGPAPYTGTYKPLGFSNYSTCGITSTVTTFGMMGGGVINPNGTWQLKLFDSYNISSNQGVLNNWSISVSSGDNAPWSLSGNSNTSANNFIGTIDYNPLRFKVNYVNAGLIDASSANTSLGQFSLNRISTGVANTAFGQYALQGNDIGNTNTAIGESALNSNSSGNFNTAAGALALSNNSIGIKNSALGHNANLSTSDLNNATAIGADALVSQSNSLILGSINGVNGATSSVNVGIGITNPNTTLHVVGSGSLGFLYQEKIQSGGIQTLALGANSNATEIQSLGSVPLYINYSGNNTILNATSGKVGIGCTSPNYALQVFGDIAAQGGTLRATSAIVSTSINVCSDIRFKKNITPLQNSLDNVLKLNGVNYFWKTKEFPEKYFNEDKQIGFIAQEVEKIYPELVLTDKDGFKSVDYSKLTPILVEAIKDLNEQIKFLRAENKKIESDNSTFKNKIERIESLLEINEKAEK